MKKPFSLDRATAAKEWRERFDNRAPIARDAKKFVVRAALADTTEILLYDEIGFWGVSAKDFNTALAAVATKNITLRINSPGGDVFEGYAMYNALKAHAATVNVMVDGIAASAASFIAMAGDTISMAEPSMLMIHRAFSLAIGNAADMTAMAALLAKVDGQIADIYAAKTGKPTADMLALMDAETWLDAQEAADLGMVDEIGEGDALEPCCDPDSPDYNPDDPDCDCPEAEAKRAMAHAARVRAVAALTRRAA